LENVSVWNIAELLKNFEFKVVEWGWGWGWGRKLEERVYELLRYYFGNGLEEIR